MGALAAPGDVYVSALGMPESVDNFFYVPPTRLTQPAHFPGDGVNDDT
jgi:hypothetical protein